MTTQNVAFLHTPTRLIPLTCVEWTTTWNVFWSARALCHMRRPQNTVQRDHLRELMMLGRPVPCWLPDPASAGLLYFQALVTDVSIPGDAVVCVGLVADGTVTVFPASAIETIIRAYRRERRTRRRQQHRTGKE